MNLNGKNKTKSEFWRWEELHHRDKSVDWRHAKKIVAGVDVGSVSTQAVVLADGKILSYSSIRTGFSSPASAENALSLALLEDSPDLQRLDYIIGTGYGRVNVPFASRTITEISCHARGANYIFGPSVRTVLDMGGQDCKVIKCDENGRVLDFMMNDKCAAGTGRGMEIIAELLAIPIAEIGPLSLTPEKAPAPLSSTCVLFARSEALSLLREGHSKAEVLAAYCAAMVERLSTMLVQMGMQPEFAITGGISKNVGIVRRLEDKLKVKSLPGKLDAQLAGALGAALFALDAVASSNK